MAQLVCILIIIEVHNSSLPKVDLNAFLYKILQLDNINKFTKSLLFFTAENNAKSQSNKHYSCGSCKRLGTMLKR